MQKNQETQKYSFRVIYLRGLKFENYLVKICVLQTKFIKKKHIKNMINIICMFCFPKYCAAKKRIWANQNYFKILKKNN